MGANLGYTSPAGPQLTNATESGELELTKDGNDLFVSIFNIGALFGGPIGGIVMNIIGRKKTMLFSVVPFLTAWALIGATINLT